MQIYVVKNYFFFKSFLAPKPRAIRITASIPGIGAVASSTVVSKEGGPCAAAVKTVPKRKDSAR